MAENKLLLTIFQNSTIFIYKKIDNMKNLFNKLKIKLKTGGNLLTRILLVFFAVVFGIIGDCIWTGGTYFQAICLIALGGTVLFFLGYWAYNGIKKMFSQ